MEGSVAKKLSFFVLLIGSNTDMLLCIVTGLVMEAAS